MYILALGSNLANRRDYLHQAKQALLQMGIRISKESYIYESPALLPKNADQTWHRAYLNQAIRIETSLKPLELLKGIKNIEQQLGRTSKEFWAPRNIDIDIIYSYEEHLKQTAELEIPHPRSLERAFVLSPLADLCPNEILNFKEYQMTGLALKRNLQKNIPKLMAILNLSTDSFSQNSKDFENNFIEEKIIQCIENNIAIVDIGAESTRPGAQSLSAEQEWQRLEKLFELIAKKQYNKDIHFSLDTYHPENMKKAIEAGFHMINDVSGFVKDETIQLIKANPNTKFVFMHNLGLPADPKKTLDSENASLSLTQYLSSKLHQLQEFNIDTSNIIFDPGLGFGKNLEQNWNLIRNIKNFLPYPIEILVGHSRKSFLNSVTNKDFSQRNIESLSISQYLADSCDYLRIHDFQEHQRMLICWQNLKYNQ